MHYRPGTAQGHKAPDGISRNPPGVQNLILARKRDWIDLRARIRGKPVEEEEDDEDAVLPELASEDEEWFHEDLFDNWLRSAEPQRSLKTLWTGRTELEKTDGNLITFVHDEPRMTLYVPGNPDDRWTGRRRVVVRYQDPDSLVASSGPVAKETGKVKDTGRNASARKAKPKADGADPVSGDAPKAKALPQQTGMPSTAPPWNPAVELAALRERPVPSKEKIAYEQAAALAFQSLEEALLSASEVKPIEGELRVLFLAPFASAPQAEEESVNWSRKISRAVGYDVQLTVGDPTYSDLDIECRGYWFRPHARRLEEQCAAGVAQGSIDARGSSK